MLLFLLHLTLVLQAFAAWLQQRSKNGDEDTYIIDAANVGYYNQQSDGQVGEFSWTQVGYIHIHTSLCGYIYTALHTYIYLYVAVPS